VTQPPNLLLLDASCLLNLYATGRLRDIALAQPQRLGVADYVLEQEALYVWRPGSGEARDERVTVDLSPFVAEGVIQVLRLEHQEEEATFVDMAALVDDGEAITAALALHRGCAVATDDRKARRVLAEQAPTVPLVSTLDLLKKWAERSSVAATDLRTAMLAMQSGASYVPGERDPLYEWWRTVVHDKGPL
jgi:predicted nucleic acid-binding protein